jgi:hypothetical protein
MKSFINHAVLVFSTVGSFASWAQTEAPAHTPSIQDILNAARDTQPKPLSAEALKTFLSERVTAKGSIWDAYKKKSSGVEIIFTPDGQLKVHSGFFPISMRWRIEGQQLCTDVRLVAHHEADCGPIDRSGSGKIQIGNWFKQE